MAAPPAAGGEGGDTGPQPHEGKEPRPVRGAGRHRRRHARRKTHSTVSRRTAGVGTTAGARSKRRYPATNPTCDPCSSPKTSTAEAAAASGRGGCTAQTGSSPSAPSPPRRTPPWPAGRAQRLQPPPPVPSRPHRQSSAGTGHNGSEDILPRSVSPSPPRVNSPEPSPAAMGCPCSTPEAVDEQFRRRGSHRCLHLGAQPSTPARGGRPRQPQRGKTPTATTPLWRVRRQQINEGNQGMRWVVHLWVTS